MSRIDSVLDKLYCLCLTRPRDRRQFGSRTYWDLESGMPEMKDLLDALTVIIEVQTAADPGDLPGLVALGEDLAAWTETLQSHKDGKPLAPYASAAAAAAHRIVLSEVDDGAAALQAIRDTLQWLVGAIGDVKSPRQMDADLVSRLTTASDVEGLSGAESAGVAGPAEPGTEGRALGSVALKLATIEPGDAEILAGVRGEIAALLEANPSWPALARESLSAAIEVIQRIEADGCSDASPLLGELTRLIEGAQETIDGLGDPVDASAPSGAPGSETAPAAKEPVASVEERLKDFADALAGNDAELVSEFVNECLDHTERAEAALLQIETAPDDTESINAVFRAFHTIKGTSGFLGLTMIQEVAHRAETLLDRARSGQIRLTGGYADLALDSADALQVLVQSAGNCLSGQEMTLPENLDSLLAALANPEAAGYSGEPTEAADDVPRVGDILVAQGKVSRERVEDVEEHKDGERLGEALVHSKAAKGRDVVGALRTQKRMAGKDASSETAVRVRLDRLDSLINMVGELVIAHSMIAQDETILNDTGKLARNVNHMGKITRDLQDLGMSLRMVPLKSTFQKMTRLVRDVAQKRGRKVQLITEGEDTEVDRNMVEAINDPLVHMVRNAVDHGIESPEDRVAVGKNPVGTVTLRAYHTAGKVVIELQDDGKGLNRQKIIDKAIERELIESDAGMTDSEIFDLVFRPGFSTADKVTEVSGRGVGMDVVRRGIEALNGRTDIASTAGKGSTFSMRLPLTLAIIDGMVIRVAEQRYIIPMGSIHTTFQPEADALSVVTERGEMVMLHDDLLPVFRMHAIFGTAGAITDPTQGLLLVVEDDGHKAAVLVDDLVGQQQVVVKSLADGLGTVEGISGGAIMGDGRVGLIVDVQGLVNLGRGTALADRPIEPLAAVTV